ncbi:replication protein A 70 kDa DNA-binding subunit B-like [Chenopodium quinoa]|uniref:replication protein A 70 kDa DNA-binding subunit B-like n=1 Tax=Chenopodium quinoa TaxID=63459 RepID=UPI000B788383|nr:replication protein A 70 kDa DNA-binding subunit B-like [Chenopodium quinoa]
MKPQYVPLDKLTPKNKRYKIKVKVKEKSPAKYPENKKAYQKLVFEDDQGNRIRGTLFDDKIENFEGILEHEKEYVIADGPIRNTNPMYRHKEDILGVVIYLEDTRRKKTNNGYEFDVRDVVVVDDSIQKLGDGLVISLCGELATKECAKLTAWCESFIIVSFRHLQPAQHTGFSLASSMSTTIDTNPTGPEVDALKAWIPENEDRISDHMGHQLTLREGGSSNVIMTIKDLNNKKSTTTTAYERHWLQVTIPNAKKEDVNAHIGCNGCGKHCPNVETFKFYCDVCKAQCIAEKRVSVSFTAADDTGSIRLTAYGKQCETLLGLKDTELIQKKITDWPEFEDIASQLKEKPFKLEVGPTGAIKRIGYLKWVVKSVVRE